MQKPQLNLCPFCGSNKVALSKIAHETWGASCQDCGCCGPVSKDEKMAKLYWGCRCNDLKWTKIRPRKPGFYFYKSSKGKIIVTHIERLELIYRHGITGIMMVDGDVEQELDRLPGQWAGPIPEPAN